MTAPYWTWRSPWIVQVYYTNQLSSFKLLNGGGGGHSFTGCLFTHNLFTELGNIIFPPWVNTAHDHIRFQKSLPRLRDPFHKTTSISIMTKICLKTIFFIRSHHGYIVKLSYSMIFLKVNLKTTR